MNIYSVETHSHHDEYILDDRGVRSVIFIHGDIHYNHHGPNASRTMSEIREYQRGKKKQRVWQSRLEMATAYRSSIFFSVLVMKMGKCHPRCHVTILSLDE